MKQKILNELNLGENHERECKLEMGGAPENIWETYSSFARYWWLPTGYKYPISIW